jgi:hypothetical protein
MDFHQLNEELDVSFDTIMISGPNLDKDSLATVIIKGNKVGCVIDRMRILVLLSTTRPNSTFIRTSLRLTPIYLSVSIAEFDHYLCFDMTIPDLCQL